jgi:hypothetical protein
MYKGIWDCGLRIADLRMLAGNEPVPAFLPEIVMQTQVTWATYFDHAKYGRTKNS